MTPRRLELSGGLRGAGFPPKGKAMRAQALGVLTAAALAAAALAGDASASLAAGLPGGYSSEAQLEVGAYDEGNQFLVRYRYYPQEIVDEDAPFRLQPFLQRATYGEAALESGPGEAWLFALGGRHMFSETPFGALATFGFGNALVDAETDDYESLVFGRLGFDFYVVDEFAIEARLEFGDRGGNYNELQGGVRLLAEVVKTGDTIEIYAGYRALRTESDDADGLVVQGRYFFDKHLFAGIEIAGDTGLLCLSGGCNADKGFLAELGLGFDLDDAKKGLEAWGDFFRIMIGLQF